jgi:hypothetical protein
LGVGVAQPPPLVIDSFVGLLPLPGTYWMYVPLLPVVWTYWTVSGPVADAGAALSKEETPPPDEAAIGRASARTAMPARSTFRRRMNRIARCAMTSLRCELT